jgi:hypothetical protein
VRRAASEDSQARWPDGTKRSDGNGFTHGILGIPHGYVVGAAAKPSKRLDGRTSRATLAFGNLNGTVPGMGMDELQRGYMAHQHRQTTKKRDA